MCAMLFEREKPKARDRNFARKPGRADEYD